MTRGAVPAAQEAASQVAAALERLYLRTRGGAPRDPARTRRLLDRLGVPDPANVVHVVGTNGKGTVAARIDAGLRAAGRTPLLFLSPHVERFHERIAVGGAPLDDGELLAFLDRADRLAGLPPPAFFELALALALDVARARGADWAVLEAGVGAARDATMAVGSTRAVVVTNVSEDHLDAIGPDLEAVARDKAAAVRPGVPVVTAAEGPALAILRDAAAQRGAPLHVLTDGGPAFAWPAAADPRPGGVAETTARLAFAALRALRLPGPAEVAALVAASKPHGLPARRERFALAGGRTVVLDGAHNVAAATALAGELPPDVHLLLGVAGRKDAAGVRDAFGRPERLVLTEVTSGDRPWGDDPAFVADADEALSHALAALPPGGTLVVAGSFHLAGRLRPRLRALARTEPDARSDHGPAPSATREARR